jgi:PIN domain nuclease of toxin-antitoxin system
LTRLLADTHAALWWLADDPALSAPARAAIADPTNEILVSAASFWEAAIKRGLGKLRAPDDLPRLLDEEGFDTLPVTAAHAWAVQSLPPHHRDPFDRLLIAQAQAEGATIVTADRRFDSYNVAVCW